MSDPIGWKIALERIAAEKEAKTGFLDLGRLGLTELPDELFELEHLNGLNLGSRWFDQMERPWKWSESNFERNRVEATLPKLIRLRNLSELYLNEMQLTSLKPLANLQALQAIYCSGTPVSDLTPLANLQALQTIDCSGTPVSDLTPLANLQALQTIDCSFTPVSDLTPLAKLQALQTIHCIHTSVSDLTPLANLQALQSINSSYTEVSDLTPLANLQALQTIDCSETPVSDLTPLANLQALQRIICRSTQVSDLTPLANLQALQSIGCSNTPVSDLTPLANLQALQSIDCRSTLVSDLTPLANLQALQSIDCSNTPVSDLTPLANLQALQSIDCLYTRVSDLTPLANLQALQTIHCRSTPVSDLTPLANLQALQLIDCFGTEVSDITPLANLQALQTIDCSDTPVSDLKPLLGLNQLQELHCEETHIETVPEWLVRLPELKKLSIGGQKIQNMAPEVLSKGWYDNCLERLRAYFDDLAKGAETLTDVKLIVIGNGQIGKTQICRRLYGQNYDASEKTTHGIVVRTVDGWKMDQIPNRHGQRARLHLWDFGGQDLYHGTHTLFLKSSAIFMVVWAKGSEDENTHTVDGMTFRNHKLPYWIENVRFAAGTDQPLLVVQNQCEQAQQEVKPWPPLAKELLENFQMQEVLQFSAKTGRKRATLDEAICQAIDHEWNRHGKYQIPIGRLRVKHEIEELQKQNALGRNRTLTRNRFEEICNKEADVSSPEMLLQYLNDSGVLMYRPGLFNNDIILDHAWALEAIYSVFDRTKSYGPLKKAQGRFTRTELEKLVWSHYKQKEQELFLSWMVSCGICFVYRDGDEKQGREREYIAPDLLPERTEIKVHAELQRDWLSIQEPVMGFDVGLAFLHPGLIRGLICQVGELGGTEPTYWNNGFSFFDMRTNSRCLVEQHRDENPERHSGRLEVRTRGGNVGTLLAELRRWLEAILGREFQKADKQAWQISPIAGTPETESRRHDRDQPETGPTDSGKPELQVIIGQRDGVKLKENLENEKMTPEERRNLIYELHGLEQTELRQFIQIYADYYKPGLNHDNTLDVIHFINKAESIMGLGLQQVRKDLNEFIANGRKQRESKVAQPASPDSGQPRKAHSQTNGNLLENVLFVGVTPRNRAHQPTRWDEEINQISQYFQNEGLSQPRILTAATIDQFREALLRFEPSVVHFSGHCDGVDGLVFEDRNGMAKPVQPDALSNLFEFAKNHVSCVILNACYTKAQAELIASHIPWVIGMKNAIGVDAAIVFSKGFYNYLIIKRNESINIETAYKWARNGIDLNSIPESLTPVLFKPSQKP